MRIPKKVLQMQMQGPSATLSDLPDENPHYIRRVTEVGDTQEIVAHEDIYASNGMKLLAKGALIDSRQFERLTRHKLSVPLDRLLTAKEPVDANVLAVEVTRILDTDARYRHIAARTGDPLALKHALGELRLPDAILLRMTVMRERFPEMYQHSVRTAMLAFALAQRLALSPREKSDLLLAALCHDMGEMHTDPAVLEAGHDITPQERRYVHVHPITAQVLLRDLPGFPPAAAQAILHHHERLDGSGYPSSLAGAQISRLAQLLAVADVAEAVMKRFAIPRALMLFRLNQVRFDPAAVGALRDLISMNKEAVEEAPEVEGAVAQLAHLTSLLQQWTRVRSSLKAPEGQRSPVDFLFVRMGTIRSLVLQAGFDPDNMTDMLTLAQDDPGMMLELREMLDEMDWLLDDLANEIDRRSPELSGLSKEALDVLKGQLRPA